MNQTLDHHTAFHRALFAAPALAALLFVAAPHGDLGAQMLCSRPVAPICATTIPATEPSAATDASVARQRCIEDATTYREKLGEYRACLDAAAKTAEHDLEAADALLKCLQDGGSDCRIDEPG